MLTSPIFDFLQFSHPTHEQEVALKALELFVLKENQDDFLILCGAAGTGKTSLTSALVGYLNHLGIAYKISAPTGRAARIIGKKSKSVATTIHSLIYNTKTDEKSGITSFTLKENKNTNFMVFIIDEASMIPKDKSHNDEIFNSSQGLLFDLVEYIKKGNVHNKIIFLGDTYQLPPIHEITSYALQKEFLVKTFNFTGESYLLTEVKRQEDGSYILENATDMRKAMDRNEKMHPISGKKTNIYQASLDYVENFKSRGPEDAISIAVSHKANKFFNDLVREKIFGRAKKMLENGDFMIILRNWSRDEFHLYNGDHVQIIDVDWSIQEQVAGLHFVAVKIKPLFMEKEIIIEDYLMLDTLLSENGQIASHLEKTLVQQRMIKNPVYRESQNPGSDRYVGALRLGYGHAITCNKAQGGEWRKVFINCLGIPSLKWQYTAVTRAKEEIEKF